SFMRISKLALALCIGGALAASSAFANSLNAGPDSELVPSGKGFGIVNNSQAHENANPHHGGGGSGNGTSYHGGPVMLGVPNIYFIWYGQSNWPTSSASSILTNFAQNDGGSPYYNINTTYYNGSNTHLSNATHFSGSKTHSETYGTSLSD